MTPWVFVDSINSSSKPNLIEDADNPDQIEKEYNPFLVNRAFSYFRDTIWLVNILNKYHGIDKKLQYDFLLTGIRPAKRWSKWAKKVDEDNLSLVKAYYKLSDTKASIALSLLTAEQIEALKASMDTGGLK